MRGQENIIPHKFPKGQSGNPNGRPPKLPELLKKEGLKGSQINDLILSMLAMNKQEIDEIIANPLSTSFELLVASAIKRGVSKGDLTQIFSQALTRALGQPKQEIEQTGDVSITINKTYADNSD
ncbi:DUF5681 domain-containing protein [Sulfurimonas sp.]|uniref:DUF5681 domain-containing protein n=1 Tax=Sulfurimonas sp. TaxID=2022749 RepID=UPI0025FFD1F4|nr:DUF5681 domain-containing protein [Sulfurimonas sp.]MCK9474074.1 DUF5681 domain-containing protein [Sulfurimonas sp.]